MTIKFFVSWLLLLSSISASAIESGNCPTRVKIDATFTRLYKDSIYQDVPGWKDAQKVLQGLDGFVVNLRLRQKAKDACMFKDYDGNRARFATTVFRDPEEPNGVSSDQLSVTLPIDGSLFVTYIPIKEYSTAGLVPYSKPFTVKIKTRLYVKETKRWTNFDMGMISVTVE